MVMGHIGFGDTFSKWIHGFHMPMFFLLSGYFHKDYTMCDLVKKLSKTLLIPYIIFGCCHTLLYFIWKKAVDTKYLYILFWENTYEGGVAIAGALWFLTAMFLAEIFYCLITNTAKLIIVQNFLVVVISVIGMCLPILLPVRLPYGIDIAMVSVGMLHVGALLKSTLKRLIELPLWVGLILMAMFSVSTIFINSYVDMRDGNYGLWPLFWVNALGMTVALWNICRSIEDSANKYYLCGCIKWIESIGSASIIYLCLNQLTIKITEQIIAVLNLEMKDPGIVILILVLVELRIAEIAILNTPLRVIVGKKF